MTCSREMPRYRCHKTVWALRIAQIVPQSDGSAVITPEESGYAPFSVPADYMTRHDPKVGGYYIVYPGGYKSWSPAEPFESGYTPIKPVPDDDADARRIVTCVNACEGINPEAVPKLVEALAGVASFLDGEDDSDDGVVNVDGMADYESVSVTLNARTVRAIRAALAKAKGGAS